MKIFLIRYRHRGSWGGTFTDRCIVAATSFEEAIKEVGWDQLRLDRDKMSHTVLAYDSIFKKPQIIMRGKEW